MPIAAKDASDRVEQLTILTERLVDLVESEIEFLKTRHPANLKDHTAERDKLAAIYAKEMTLIRQDRTLVTGAESNLITRLKTATGRFRERIAEHQTVVGAMRAVSEGILKSVAAQAQAETPCIAGYGKDAGLRNTPHNRAPSLALNEMV